jgi:chloramphenicol 3-O phosphotransferase
MGNRESAEVRGLIAEGQIIVLNGASSSGETSLLKALQGILEEPYLDAGIDRFIWMLPPQYLERPLWDDVLGYADRAGKSGHSLVSGMHRAAGALTQAGNNVLIDHVLLEAIWVQEPSILGAGATGISVWLTLPA